MKYNETLINQLKNNEIILENIDFTTDLRNNNIVALIIKKAFPSSASASGNSRFYYKHPKYDGNWQASTYESSVDSSLPIVSYKDFLNPNLNNTKSELLITIL